MPGPVKEAFIGNSLLAARNRQDNDFGLLIETGSKPVALRLEINIQLHTQYHNAQYGDISQHKYSRTPQLEQNEKKAIASARRGESIGV